MSDNIDITIRSTFDDKGIADATREAARLRDALKPSTTKPFDAASVSAAKLAEAEAKAATQTQRLATEQNRTAQAAQRLATEEQRTAGAVASAAAASTRAEGAALRLAAAKEKAAGSSKSLTSTVQGLAAGLGTLGIAFGAQQVIQFGVEAAKGALSLDKADKTLRAVTGSATAYNEALSTAKQQQILFGGSLEANIGGLTGLAITAKQSGAELKQLVDLSQRLGTLDPAQGVGGARVALSEALSGDPTSLAKRYEIPKAALAALRDESIDASAKLAILDQYLNTIGITSAAAGGAISETARTYNQLGIVLDGAKNAFGSFVAEGAAPAAAALVTLATDGGSSTAEAMARSGVAAMDLAASLSLIPPQTEATRAANLSAATAMLQFVGVQSEATAVTAAAAPISDQAALLDDKRAIASTTSAGAIMVKVQADIAAATSGQLYTNSEGAAIIATQESANAALLAAEAKAQYTAQMALLEGQTRSAGDSFLALNPNISQSGVASAVASGAISSAVGQYIAMTLATAGARAELARLQNQAGVAAAIGGAGRNTDNQTQMRAETNARREQRTEQGKQAQASVQGYRNTQAAAKKAASDEQQAQLIIAQATKNTGKQVEILNAQYKAASGDAIKQAQIQAQLIGLQSGKGGGGGGAGKSPRVTEAEKAGGKLASIEQSTGDKLSTIDQATQDKLLAIDKKAADARVQQQRDLAEAMLTTSADMVASQEANDLDLIGAKEDQLGDLAARESAEAQARIAEAQAVAEAQKTASEGQADVAKDVYDIRQNQIASQQRLDEEYAKRQQELSSNPEALTALKTQYDEATAAIQTSAQVRIELARAESEQRKAAATEEKDAVLASAEQQRSGVVGKALDQASGVKNASADQRSSVVSNAKAQADEAISYAEKARAGVTAAYAGISATPAASSAGTATTPTAPASGTRNARGTRNSLRNGPVDVAAAGSLAILGSGTTPVLAMPTATSGAGGAGVPTPAAANLKDQIEQTRAEIALLNDLIKLKAALSPEAGRAIDVAIVRALANDAQQVASIVAGSLIPSTKKANESLDLATKNVSAASSALLEMLDLKKRLADRVRYPIDPQVLRYLAEDAQRVAQTVAAALAPASEAASEGMQNTADLVGAAVATLNDILDLKKGLQDRTKYPIDPQVIKYLAQDAARVAGITAAQLQPASEEAATGMTRAAAVVGGAVSALTDIVDLKESLQKRSKYPIDPALIRALAQDAKRVTEIVSGILVPQTEESAKQLGLYADAAGSSVGIIKEVGSLTADMFADYASPTDAQITRIAKDADRITRQIAAAAATYDTKGLEAAKLFADAVGGTFSAFKDGLLFFDALNSGDFTLDTAALARFEESTRQTLAVADRLGAQAALIPPGNLAALQTTTAALSSQAEALIRLAAVPWGDLGMATAGLVQNGGMLLGGGGGGGSTNISNTFYITGSDPQQVANMVIDKITMQVQTRR